MNKRSLLILVTALVWGMSPSRPATAGVLDDLRVGISHYGQPSTNTGGTLAIVTLPYGTLPRLYPILPDRIVGRMYWGVGGRVSSQGPGAQPPDGLLVTGLGLKFHELLGVSAGLSHYQRGETLTTLFVWSVDLDGRIIGEVFSQDLLKKLVGP
mgnify:FL=1